LFLRKAGLGGPSRGTTEAKVKNLKLLLLAVMASILLLGCEGPRVKSNTENLNIVVVPYNSKDMQKAVEILKENMVFFKIKNKCFGCVFSYAGERAITSLVEVSCEGLE
jgi:hypothetical protein